MWHDLLVATALMLVIEGLIPFVSPAGMRNALLQIVQLNDQTLRFIGLSSMLLGVILLYLVN